LLPHLKISANRLLFSGKDDIMYQAIQLRFRASKGNTVKIRDSPRYCKRFVLQNTTVLKAYCVCGWEGVKRAS